MKNMLLKYCYKSSFHALALDQDIANKVANGLCDSLSKNWGGITIYIPSQKDFERKKRNQKIYDQFNGNNYADLAKKFRISEKQIRICINQVQVQVQESMQLELQGLDLDINDD